MFIPPSRPPLSQEPLRTIFNNHTRIAQIYHDPLNYSSWGSVSTTHLDINLGVLGRPRHVKEGAPAGVLHTVEVWWKMTPQRMVPMRLGRTADEDTLTMQAHVHFILIQNIESMKNPWIRLWRESRKWPSIECLVDRRAFGRWRELHGKPLECEAGHSPWKLVFD